MFGFGKKRSKFGKWLDRQRMTQEELREAAKIGRNTASRVCSDPEYTPSASTIKKLMKVVRRVDPNAKVDDFFDM
ncbi:helix-turn-helix domain-containing protein [Bacillus sp. HNG]|uniref:helix-turn-helix domain-containing protein n=1 Tax=Bacillus sp. HNG TaxID=2293325 RepID=UPI001CB99E28|nr:helix-turn-helix transcriptional regulator [Bacillus sp. HNG]